jgi:hypothetical protein
MMSDLEELAQSIVDLAWFNKYSIDDAIEYKLRIYKILRQEPPEYFQEACDLAREKVKG